MKRFIDQYIRLINERIERTDYFIAILQVWRVTWSIPVSIIFLFIGWIFLGNFEHAMTPAQVLMAGYTPLPSDWEAGVFNHGDFFRWYLPENHPVLYSASWIMALGPFLYLLVLLALISGKWLIDEYRKPKPSSKPSKV